VFAAQPPPLPDEDLADGMLDACCARLVGAGFERYEVSAWARATAQCRHNLNYWNFGDYLGVGAGAHGKLTFPESGLIVRTTQPREPRRYLAAVSAAAACRTIAGEELPFEFMLNALRLTAGFTAASFAARTGLGWEAIGPRIEAACRRGLLEHHGDRYRPSELGLRFLNELLLEFLAETSTNSGPSALSTLTPESRRARPDRYSQLGGVPSENELIT
jgi:coproporphyrinogen III oxidase-like Fe-S oxidoreductase